MCNLQLEIGVKHLMRLKQLTMCLLGLGLSACSTYSINQHSNTSAGLDDRAVQGLNAMYTYPSYDFNGQFDIDLALEKSDAKSAQKALDAKLQKQLDQYIAAQNIKLTKQEKADLYQVIAEGKYGTYEGSDRIKQFLSSFLKHTKFGYEGSIDFKERLATFDVLAKYEKQTLLVQTRIPMAVDLKNYKFYINYFGVMPFMVNQASQDNYAYLDFSEYKDVIDGIDFKNLMGYLQEGTAVSYVLAGPEQIQHTSMSAEDKAHGVVEKIRLKSTFEQFMLQQQFFEAANRKYALHSIIDADKLVKTQLEKMATSTDEGESEEEKYSTHGMGAEEAEAYKASTKLYRLMNEKRHDRDDVEEAVEAAAPAHVALEGEDHAENAASAATESAAADVAAAKAAADDADEGLTEEQCIALRDSKKPLALGDITYCQEEHYVYLLPAEEDDSEHPLKVLMSDEYKALEKKFEASGSDKLMTATEFKQLWAANSNEINALLAKQKQNDFVVDVGLDEKGRAIKVDYDMNLYVKGVGTFKVKSDNNVLNYGNAKTISRSQLKNAKSIEEVTKDSPFEYFVGALSRSLGGKGTTEAAAQDSHVAVKPFSQQLDELAASVYDRTGSYSKTYEAVYLMKLSYEKPKIVEYYTPRELNEIARVYAYSFADESVFNPKGKELAELEKLVEKYQLNRRNQFENELGTDVYEVTVDAMKQRQSRQDWNKFVAQYKQPKAVFAQYYMQQFLEGEDFNAQQKAQLKRVSELLAQTYLDARKGKLTEKSVANFAEGDEEFIDYSLYSDVYEKVAGHFKK